MKIRFGNVLLTAIAVSVGLVTLLGYFIDFPLLIILRLQFVAWASMLAAVAACLGAFNLVQVHFKKMTTAQPGWFYSAILLLTLVITIGVNVISALGVWAQKNGVPLPLPNWGTGPANTANAFIFQSVQSGVGTALAGLLFFFLVFAGYRLLRRPPNVMLVTFIITAVITLIGLAPLPAGIPDFGFRDLRLWLAQVPAVAGARGILLGVALGVIATGLRILLALDRPYGE